MELPAKGSEEPGSYHNAWLYYADGSNSKNDLTFLSSDRRAQRKPVFGNDYLIVNGATGIAALMCEQELNDH